MAKILFVDDDLIYLDELSQALRSLGHTVTCSASANEAKVWLEDEGFDVIMCDVIMAGGGALSLLHDLQATETKLPFVAITGRHEIATSPLFVNGMNEASAKLEKTASVHEIDKTIRSLVPS